MTGALVLAFALAHNVQAPTSEPSVEIGVVVTFTDGSTKTVSSYPGNRIVFVTRSGAACEEPTVSSRAPKERAFGWRAELDATAGDPRVAWRRLELAADSLGPKNGIRLVPAVTSREWTSLDHFDIQTAVGCKVLHWSLVARRTPAAAERPKHIEAELWLVHKAPDGKESSQRQTFRMRDGGRGDFYFDDLNLTIQQGTTTLPIVVEVFGAIHTGTMMSNGDINMTLSLTRRYINKGTALGTWPKTGSTDYPMTVKAGEVVSFLLPPLTDDGGILLGHRFSLRLRLTPLRD